MKVDGHVTPVLMLVDIYVDSDTWVIFFNHPRTFFFYDYLWRRRCGGCISRGGSYRCGRLLTSGDPE